MKERADREAIRVFQENLANLLLSPPAGPIVVMGVDWGKGDECSVAVVNESGQFLEGAKIRFKPAPERPAPKARQTDEARQPASAPAEPQPAEQGAEEPACEIPVPEDPTVQEPPTSEPAPVDDAAASVAAETTHRTDTGGSSLPGVCRHTDPVETQETADEPVVSDPPALETPEAESAVITDAPALPSR